MKYSKLIFAFAFSFVLASACKKDESTPSYKSLSGTLEIGTLPLYVNPGDEFSFTSSGVSLPESETDQSLEIIYTYKNSENNKKDTLSSYSVTIPDIVGEYTITATAELTGYYSKTSTLSTTVVSEKSLTEYDLTSLSQVLDNRDGKRYRRSSINGKWWFAQNLAYYEKNEEGEYSFGSSYYSEKATEDVFGGFYSGEEALRACPEGWRLPTVEEWDALGGLAGDMMCDSYYNGERLWEFWPEVNKTNKLKLFALPFGYATIAEGDYSFTGFNDYACFWATKAGVPVCKYIYSQTPELLEWESPSPKDFAAQIRCVSTE